MAPPTSLHNTAERVNVELSSISLPPLSSSSSCRPSTLPTGENNNVYRKFGEEGTNTTSALSSNVTKTVIHPVDGFTMMSPDDMYRFEESSVGRREVTIPNLHNLSDEVIHRTVAPPLDFEGNPECKRRAELWDKCAAAVIEALKDIPAGAHVNVSANSGPNTGEVAAAVEKQAPSVTIKDAHVGLLFVAEFRKDGDVHPEWIQIAVPIKKTEGRLLAGVRLLPIVVGRSDLIFHITNMTNPSLCMNEMEFVREFPELTYGCVSNAWKPTNLGCFFHRGPVFQSEHEVIRASFAWDGDLYGWDEAITYMRKPVAVVTDKKPDRRFKYWYADTVLRGISWYHIRHGKLHGGLHAETRRADVVRWDEAGWIEGKFIDE